MRFSLYTARCFQESESGAVILFMKIQAGIVHLVTRAHRLCYKAALGLSITLPKTATLGIIWSDSCAKCVFLYIKLDVFKRVRVVQVSFHKDTRRNCASSDYTQKCCRKKALGLLFVLSQTATF